MTRGVGQYKASVNINAVRSSLLYNTSSFALSTYCTSFIRAQRPRGTFTLRIGEHGEAFVLRRRCGLLAVAVTENTESSVPPGKFPNELLDGCQRLRACLQAGRLSYFYFYAARRDSSILHLDRVRLRLLPLMSKGSLQRPWVA